MCLACRKQIIWFCPKDFILQTVTRYVTKDFLFIFFFVSFPYAAHFVYKPAVHTTALMWRLKYHLLLLIFVIANTNTAGMGLLFHTAEQINAPS